MRVAAVVGARPQFVKAAMGSRTLRRIPGIVEVLIHTGQHSDEIMADVFFEELEIPHPDVHLGVGSGSHGAQKDRTLEKLETQLAGG